MTVALAPLLALAALAPAPHSPPPAPPPSLDRFYAVDTSADALVAVAIATDGRVAALDVLTGQPRAVQRLPRTPMRVAVSDDGCRVAILDDAGGVHIGSTSLEDLRRVTHLVAPGRKAMRWPMGGALDFAPDGERLLVDVGAEGSALLDGEGALVARVPGRRGAFSPARLQWSPDGAWFAGFDGPRLWLRDGRTGAPLEGAEVLGSLAVGEDAVCFSVHPDGRTVATGHLDGRIRLWDLGTAQELRSWQHEDPMGFDADQWVAWLAFDPTGKRLAFTSCTGVFLGIIELDDSRPLRYSDYCDGRMGEPATIAWDQEGAAVWWSFASGAMELHRRQVDGVRRDAPAPGRGNVPAFDGEGHGLCVGSGRVVAFDAETWAFLWELRLEELPEAAPRRPRARGAARAEELYAKSEHRIRMRDGVELHTAVFVPRELDEPRGILLKRTPYSCRPYGPGAYPAIVGPSEAAMEHGFIVVLQDVRGRWMSDGTYDNMRPHVPGDAAIDESSDTWDTIEWLVENVPGNNGRVGMWGISYPGFYCTAALPEHHPALVCSAPQASIADFFFDDFHHQGAFLLSYLTATPTFGHQKTERTTTPWYAPMPTEGKDAYAFFLGLGPLSNATPLLGEDNVFWEQLREHPNYDSFWRARSILPHLRDVSTRTLIVGGWYDAEDLYGPLQIYRALERDDPGGENCLVMGPWSHGDWARSGSRAGQQVVGDLDFGTGLSDMFAEEVELPFFVHHLEGGPAPNLPEALVYDTGARRWEHLDAWPPADSRAEVLRLAPGGVLSSTADAAGNAPLATFVSDPADPVPYREEVPFRFTPRPYMGEDQAFVLGRPDVLVFETEPLEAPLTVAGPIDARLVVSTTGTDADWIVKVVDVHPAADGERPVHEMVRSEVARARFREDMARPVPMEPGAPTEVLVKLQDVLHTFPKGHRLAIHVQSTWFPLIDRNPQRFVPNIYEAEADDFRAATHTVHAGSRLELTVR